MPIPNDFKSSSPLGAKHIPGLLSGSISTVVKILDKFDLFENDGLIAAIPFGKLAVFGYKSLKNFKKPVNAIRRCVGTAVGICFGAALADFGTGQLTLTAAEEKRFKASLTTAFKEGKLDLDKFDPEQLAATDIAQNFFRKYLAAFDRAGVDDGRPPENRVRPHLELYLQEWLPSVYQALLEKDPDRYAIIGSTLKSKSRQLTREVIALKAYRQHLFSLYTTAAGSLSSIPLSTLYLRARTQVQTMLLSESKERHDPSAEKFTPAGKADLPDDLHNLVLAWLGLSETPLDCNKLRTQEDPRLLLLYGQPGQGKTSFCKRLLYDLMSARVHYHRPVYFLRLRDIKEVSGLREDPLDHLRQQIESVHDITIPSADFNRSILILDGMDELAMSNGMTIDSADRLLSGIEDQLKHHPDLRIIVTSRHGYLRADDRLHKDFLVLQIANLERDQQEEWLARYQKETGKTTLTAETLKGIGEDSSLGQLLTQPLLLQLVADLDELPADTAARAGVYDHIFNHLIETPWKTGQIKTLENLTDKEVQENFREALREIAFELFIRGGEALPGSVVNQLESVTHLSKQLGRDEAEDGLRLMQVAFYFQDKLDRETGQYAIEFQHKSFGEYLAAEYFYEEVMLRFLRKDDRDRGYRYTGAAALAEWHKLASRRPFTMEMIHYLIEIIQRDDREERQGPKSELKTRLLDLAEHWFTAGFIDPADTKADYDDPVTERGLMSGYLWFVVASGLNSWTLFKKKGKYQFDAINLIEKLKSNSLVWDLRGAYLGDALLSGSNFFRSNLESANLSGSMMLGSFLMNINLRRANLQGTYLSGSYLNSAALDGANFKNAMLENTHLDRIVGVNAKFTNSRLKGAYVVGADLRNTDFQGANLTDAIFDSSNLAGANVIQVSFVGATFRRANLKGLIYSDPFQLLQIRSLIDAKNIELPLFFFLKRYRPCMFTAAGCVDFTFKGIKKIDFLGEWDEEKGEWADWWIKECEVAGEEE